MKHLRLFPQPRRLIACLIEPKVLDEAGIKELGLELMEAATQARSCGKLILGSKRADLPIGFAFEFRKSQAGTCDPNTNEWS